MEPGFIRQQLQKAGDLLEEGKPADALRCLEKIDGGLFESDDRIEYAALRAWSLAQLDRTQEALDELAPVLEEFPGSARLHTTRGLVLSNIDRLDDACESLETAVALDETDGVALANLGYVYERMREYDRAVQAYDKSLEAGADMAWVLQRKATAQRDMEDYAGAKATLKRYLSLEPEDDFEWVSLAIVLSELGEYDDSFDCYRKAESLNSDSASMRFNWGLTAERAGRMDVAREQLRLLAEKHPNSSQVSILRAFILEHEGKTSAALAAHQEAIERAADETDELLYAFERAMNFCVEHELRGEAESLLKRAYRSDACSVELCEGYREMTGRHLESGAWFGINVGLNRNGTGNGHAQLRNHSNGNGRGLRWFGVIATDRDDAVGILADFLRRVGEPNFHICEFTDEDNVEDEFSGIYEVEPEETIADAEGAP